MRNVIEYMLQANQDSGADVALEACELWSAFCKARIPPEIWREFLSRLIVVLLLNMVYADDDETLVDAEVDETMPDRDQDLKPRFCTSRAHGADGAEEEEDEDDIINSWNSRKCSVVRLDVLSTVFGDEILPILMPLVQAKLSNIDISWKEKEAVVLALGAYKQMFALKDKMLYETLARLQKVDPLALGVRGEFENFILGDALYQFKQIDRFKTPLEKATCLRKAVNSILQGIQSVVKSSTTSYQDIGMLPCTDDLLSFMVLLMVRAKVQNLQANASYMENFMYINKEDGDKGELGFHMTNFVAACNYLQSKEIKDIVIQAPPKSGRVSCSFGLPTSAVHDVNVNVGEDNSNHRGRVFRMHDAEQWDESLLSSRKVGLSFPGESPDFLLASTYQ